MIFILSLVLTKIKVKAIFVWFTESDDCKLSIPWTANRPDSIRKLIFDTSIFSHGFMAKPESSGISPDIKYDKADSKLFLNTTSVV